MPSGIRAGVGGTVSDLLTPLPRSHPLCHWLFPDPRGIQLGFMVSEICSAPSHSFMAVIYVQCSLFFVFLCPQSALNQSNIHFIVLLLSFCLMIVFSQVFSNSFLLLTLDIRIDCFAKGHVIFSLPVFCISSTVRWERPVSFSSS